MLKKIGNLLIGRGREMREKRGAVNLQGIMLMGLGFVFIGVGFIVFQIFMNAADSLLAWTYTPCQAIITAGYYTGFSDIVGITPLLVLVGFMAAGVFAMYLGVQISKGAGSAKMDLGVLILLAVSIIFLAIALIILPVTLEAICSTLSNNSGAANTGQGINSAFTGVSEFLLMSPLLLIVSLIGGAIVTGFFGMKRLGSGD